MATIERIEQELKEAKDELTKFENDKAGGKLLNWLRRKMQMGLTDLEIQTMMALAKKEEMLLQAKQELQRAFTTAQPGNNFVTWALGT